MNRKKPGAPAAPAPVQSQTICGACKKSFTGLYAYMPAHYPCTGSSFIIPSHDAPAVTNLEQLARGTGARFLECTRPHAPGLPLIALKWRRRPPKSFYVLIDYHAPREEGETVNG